MTGEIVFLICVALNLVAILVVNLFIWWIDDKRRRDEKKLRDDYWNGIMITKGK